MKIFYRGSFFAKNPLFDPWSVVHDPLSTPPKPAPLLIPSHSRPMDHDKSNLNTPYVPAVMKIKKTPRRAFFEGWIKSIGGGGDTPFTILYRYFTSFDCFTGLSAYISNQID